jgi:hypothetical protein
MTTLSIFDKLANEENQRAEKLNTDYRKLVTDLAAGKEPSASKVKQLLDDIGRTMDDCRMQSESLSAASELADTCDDPELIRERDEIDAELANVGDAIPKWREQAERQERESERYREKAEKQINLPADQRSFEALAERYQAEAEKYRTEVRKLERQWHSLQNRRDNVRLKMQQA